MAWGGLRWSDFQRLLTAELCLEDNVLRGFSWRTKSSKLGMPWGILCFGVQNSNWASWLCKMLQSSVPRDFALPSPTSGNVPAGYSWMLLQLRRLLVVYGGIPASSCDLYTLHSLKATMLSWALQLELPEHHRLALGHRRVKGEHAMARKYSRDDVLPALRAQWAILVSVQGGWIPMTAQRRGGRPPVREGTPSLHSSAALVEPKFLKSAVSFRGTVKPEVEEKSSSSSDSSSDSEDESSNSVVPRAIRCEARGDVRKESGIWLCNLRSGCYHSAVRSECGSGIGSDGLWYNRACKPTASVIESLWSLTKIDPAVSPDSLMPCGNKACGLC
ncbi:unnamed protein product [Polarella glacialis]|uniref:Uncharacterized protein n=1 Tax=Polarella glacialis TaxID=89957 RepID=A0A813EN23_POLGL|nr:unnamed protein product [Polarella glacialis]